MREHVSTFTRLHEMKTLNVGSVDNYKWGKVLLLR